MQLLTSSKQFKNEFSRLLDQYQFYYWAVAWASCPEDIFEKLIQYQHRIGQISIGLHFYQTSPEFIKNFIDSEKVKFVPESSGVFHPKVFLFFNHESDWELVVGSANFTQAAFNRNTEVSLLIGSNDQNADQIWSDINWLFEKISEVAKSMSAEDFREYQDEYRAKKSNLDHLSNLQKAQVNDLGSQVKDESVQLVGKLIKIVHAELNDDGQLIIVEQKPGEGDPLTKNEIERIKSAIIEAQKLYGDILATNTRFFLVEEFFETNFVKKSDFPLRYHKLFDLKKYFSDTEYPQNARELATKLMDKTWET